MEGLRKEVGQFYERYHHEGNHQGLGNDISDADLGSDCEGEVQCRERPGGRLRYYHRDAA